MWSFLLLVFLEVLFGKLGLMEVWVFGSSIYGILFSYGFIVGFLGVVFFVFLILGILILGFLGDI